MKSFILLALLTSLSTISLASANESSMIPMNDEELSSVSAQGLERLIDQLIRNQNNPDGVKTAGAIIKLLNPTLLFLDADITMKDVVYDADHAISTVNKDGSITLALPSTIGQISFKDIRVSGSTGPSFGSIEINNIDLRGTTITVSFNGSQPLPVITPR